MSIMIIIIVAIIISILIYFEFLSRNIKNQNRDHKTPQRPKRIQQKLEQNDTQMNDDDDDDIKYF
jgi:flagellar basal body-associated protein FliL